MTVPYTFGTQSSPIPLSDLDANFAAIPNYANVAGNVLNAAQANITSLGTLIALSVTGNVNSGNMQTGTLTANVLSTSGNIGTTANISAYGNVTAGNLVGTVVANSVLSTGLITTTNNLIGGNIFTTGVISAQGSVRSQGIVSASGNIITAGYFVGNFAGNITGNLTVPGSNTQVIYNSNGNAGASAGLTYTSGPNALGVLGSVSAQGNITGNNAIVNGNLTVSGTSQFIGAITAPTAANGTSNNQVATTAFVNNKVGALGTMAAQNAVSVAITGGSIGNAIITLATISNSTIANTTIDQVTMSSGWSIVPSGTKLYFRYNGNNVASLDSAGNFISNQNTTAFGTP
jgi:hypothetical protein